MIYINKIQLSNRIGLEKLNLTKGSNKKVEAICDLQISPRCRSIGNKSYFVMFQEVRKQIETSDKISCLYCHSFGRNNPNCKYKLDDNLFNNIDCPEKAYILGWIGSDGHFNNGSIKIMIQEEDLNVIKFIRNYICKDLPITFRKHITILNNNIGWINKLNFNDLSNDDICNLKGLIKQYKRIPKKLVEFKQKVEENDFCAAVQKLQNILIDEGNTCEISFYSTTICNDLFRLFQIEPREIKENIFSFKKSDIIKFPHIDVKYYKYFVRGYLEGDGWIEDPQTKGKNHHPRCNIRSNSKEMLKQFYLLFKEKRGIYLTDRDIRWERKACIDFLSEIYEDHLDMVLDRKYKKYLYWKSWVCNKHFQYGRVPICNQALTLTEIAEVKYLTTQEYFDQILSGLYGHVNAICAFYSLKKKTKINREIISKIINNITFSDIKPNFSDENKLKEATSFIKKYKLNAKENDKRLLKNKISKQQVLDILVKYNDGWSKEKLQLEYKISQKSLKCILCREHWTDITDEMINNGR